jgi:HD-like signal output (HDOD) protein
VTVSASHASATHQTHEPIEGDYAIIVCDKGKPQAVLRSLVSLVLNFKYGLRTVDAGSFAEARQWLGEGTGSLRGVVLIQRRDSQTDIGISAFNLRDNPLFAIGPKALAPQYIEQVKRLSAGHVVAWESVFRDSGKGLRNLLGKALEKVGVTPPLQDLSTTQGAQRRRIVETRLKGIDSLPTLPGAVSRILELLSDPDVTAEQLERAILLDPSIVQRLMSVAGSPAFAARSGEPPATLRDAIVRMGMREVAAVAMQAKLATSFARSQDTLFDYQRFWAHSVACALVAHRLVTDRSLPLAAAPEFSDYWIVCLLHDIGKLVMGTFFWEHFARVMGESVTGEMSFREAERRLGDVAHHTEIGQLVLERSHMKPLLTQTVGHHHDLPDIPEDLDCLLHVSNYICHRLGMSYPVGGDVSFDDKVFQAMHLSQQDIDQLADDIGGPVLAQVKELLSDAA